MPRSTTANCAANNCRTGACLSTFWFWQAARLPYDDLRNWRTNESQRPRHLGQIFGAVVVVISLFDVAFANSAEHQRCSICHGTTCARALRQMALTSFDSYTHSNP